ncbi:hypothetical protein F442_20857 [Phytophthora nicotianae P10297]|uniref:Uncharacterized protein n=3 Tax=Phytophthora nicotianae TaxID=4792 RepID=W2PIK5_PHYN3|nr:hypothetical protein PPTG_18348 [Phytophthora nicotianae INRA-310]ETN00079.1 hypothetical protein PPTG_18348 [Phytophthora nicotianae INRA-310]ETP30081.1 hypothetical protein F442_20857 [Phytophthora nicotianae P10297]KUF79316.1 hypothetical protein AM587_10005523 [Phytophthora nicotianae]KUF96549.1 hypothetical protein AM587_10005598 [Phytophthora nicotianae]
MLNSRRARVLPPRQPQRLIWSRASDFVAWLGLGPNTNPEASGQQQTQPPKSRQAPTSSPSPPSRLAVKRVLRPQPPADNSFPTFQRSLESGKRKAAAHALGRFSLEIKHVPSSTQLLDAWQVVSQCRPFVVDSEKPLQVRLATAADVGDNRPWLLQIVPADAFAQLSVDISTRSMFVGSTGPDLDADVVVANEALMVGNLVKAFHQMNEHKLAVAFFEAYDRDRRVWLQEHQLRQAAKVLDDDISYADDEDEAEVEAKEKPVPIEHVTQLPRAVYSCYLRSLATLKQTKKIVRLFENDEHQLERICSTVPNLQLLLHACYSEKNGELARRAIDTITHCSPAAVIPLGCYELAIRSNLRDRKRDERELVTAIHLAKALQNDGGYTLKPDIWSGLIKVSLNMNRPDLALEVFKSYPRHCIPEYQTNFRQVLRAACRFTDSTALDMMHFCWANYGSESSNAKTLLEDRKAYHDTICLNNPDTRGLSLGDAVLASTIPVLNKEAEIELLNMMLWEMLKHRHAVPSLVQVLDIMEATRSKGGAVALRQTVRVLFEYDMKKMSPHEAVEGSLKFWGERSSVLSGQGFLVYLLLEECIERHWDDECEFLVDYLLELGVARVPVNTIVKMMGNNEIRGRFEANARIGEKLLERLSQTNRSKLRDDFYERYLMSYLRLEQFDKVSEQHTKLNLEKRYPHNEVIRTIVQDATTQ